MNYLFLLILTILTMESYSTTIKIIRKPNHLGSCRQMNPLISTLSLAETGTQFLSVSHPTGVSSCVNCLHYCRPDQPPPPPAPAWCPGSSGISVSWGGHQLTPAPATDLYYWTEHAPSPYLPHGWEKWRDGTPTPPG